MKIFFGYAVPMLVCFAWVVFAIGIPDADWVDRNEYVLCLLMVLSTYIAGYFYSYKGLKIKFTNLWPVWVIPVLLAAVQLFFHGH